MLPPLGDTHSPDKNEGVGRIMTDPTTILSPYSTCEAGQGVGGEPPSDRLDERSQMLLSRSVQHTKAVQQLAKEKEALHKALTEQTELLRASEAARVRAEERAASLEHAVRSVQAATRAALATAEAANPALA